MYTEISIEYGQNKCAQKLLSSMDKINVHRNFYEYGNKKCAQKFLSMMDVGCFNYLYFFDQNLTTVTSSKATEIFYISIYL